MKCSKVIASLDQGENSQSEGLASLAVRRHLDQCPACQRQYRLDKVVSVLLASSREEIEPPPFFATRVTARLSGIKSDVEGKRGMLVWWEALRQLAAPIIAVMLVVFALTLIPLVFDRPSNSVGIEDLAIHNATNEEKLVLSNEELSQAGVSHEVLPLER
jgi:hypothetical protein